MFTALYRCTLIDADVFMHLFMPLFCVCVLCSLPCVGFNSRLEYSVVHPVIQNILQFNLSGHLEYSVVYLVIQNILSFVSKLFVNFVSSLCLLVSGVCVVFVFMFVCQWCLCLFVLLLLVLQHLYIVFVWSLSVSIFNNMFVFVPLYCFISVA